MQLYPNGKESNSSCLLHVLLQFPLMVPFAFVLTLPIPSSSFSNFQCSAQLPEWFLFFFSLKAKSDDVTPPRANSPMSSHQIQTSHGLQSPWHLLSLTPFSLFTWLQAFWTIWSWYRPRSFWSLPVNLLFHQPQGLFLSIT